MESEKELKHLSKFLSLILRHQPEVIGIEPDQNGWVEVAELISKMNDHGKNIDFQKLEEVVNTNNKKRFAFNDDKTHIRASQGHSIEVDLGYDAQKPPSLLFHGTAEQNLESILEKGLNKGSRNHVHLSPDRETARQVGMRHGKPIILTVDAGKMNADGYPFYLSKNGVWLTDMVPSNYLSY